jgi:ABC-type polysaccharide/polyol phosphate export permease
MRAVFSFFASLIKNRRLLKDFVVRDLKARYVGSSMGFFWSVVFPIINLFVFMFVFRLVLKARWSDSQGPLEVALIMLAGIVVWSAFAETLSRGTNCLVDNSNLIQKVVFPSEVLPAFLTVSALINMCAGLPVVIFCVAFFAYVSPPTVYHHAEYQDVEVALVDEAGAPLLDANGEQLVRIDKVLTEVHNNEGGEPVQLVVDLSRGRHVDVDVRVEYGGTAVRGEDFLAPTEFTIPAHAQGVVLQVQPLPDVEREPDETIIMRIVGADGARVTRGGTGTDLFMHVARTILLHDSDPPPAGAARPEELPVKVRAREAGYLPLRLGVPLLALPLLFAIQTLFVVGVVSILSAVNVFLRDTFHLVGVGITVWMFATPIFYPAHMVANAGFGWLLVINPMHWLIDSYRAVLLYASWPDPGTIGRFAVVAVVVFLAGSTFFSAHKAKFPDLL